MKRAAEECGLAFVRRHSLGMAEFAQLVFYACGLSDIPAIVAHSKNGMSLAQPLGLNNGFFTPLYSAMEQTGR